MNNGDYIPLDQAVIDQAVDQAVTRLKEARRILKGALKDAGGNFDIVVFRGHDFNEFKRIIKALEELKIFWCDIDREILVNRHEVYDAVLPKE